MSLPRCLILLPFLGLAIIPFSSGAQDPCSLTSDKTNSSFLLTVSPVNLMNATQYTVSLFSNLNIHADLLLQASANGSASGSWSVSGTTSNCANGAPVSYDFVANTSLIANWTSPSNLGINSVTIRAFLNNSVDVFKFEKVLTVAASGSHASDSSFLFLALCILVITSKFLS